MAYYARERIFIGCSPNIEPSLAIFAADDLTEDECRTLTASVQRCLDELHDASGSGPWYFDLGPSANENAAAFINLKSDWTKHAKKLDEYRQSSGNSWMSEFAWLHDIAEEHADIIRDLRARHTPTVYLQFDIGRGFNTFDCVDSLTWDEIETLEQVVGTEFYELGMILRVISDYHAEREPAEYIQARLDWKRFEEDIKKGKGDENRMVAFGVSCECIAEIKALRLKPVIYGPEEDEDESVADTETHAQGNGEVNARPEPVISASDDLRSKYRDPDNYWRNVWLYKLRFEGHTNASILGQLRGRASEFAPLETENALRTAIETIAHYHKWPALKGRAGRPKAKTAPAETPQCDLQTPQ